MGRRRKKNSVKRIHNKVFNERGCKDSNSYKSGIYTYEIPSKGKVARVRGVNGQIHHCLSQHEKHFLTILMYDADVSVIRDQVLLPLEDTLLLAAKYGLKHPYANQCPAVMSTDFYYCKGGQWQAVAIKTTEDLLKKTVQEKLELEGLYWDQEDIPWRVVTEEDIPRQLSNNLRWLHSGVPFEQLVPDQELRQNLLDAFVELYHDYTIPFDEVTRTIEAYCGQRPGTMIQAFKYLISQKTIPLDLTKPLNLIEPRDFDWLCKEIASRTDKVEEKDDSN